MALQQLSQTADLLSEASRAKIDMWLKKYPAEQQRSAVIPALHIVQEQNQGWLTTELLDAVADYLALPKIAVYEVANFYSMFELSPVGRHKICVCSSISCMLCDNESIMQHLEKRLGIKMDETTQDGKFTLKRVECLAACRNAPVLQIGHQYHENLTPEKIDAILDGLE